jgi:heme-degrading monooxygenase HmoA
MAGYTYVWEFHVAPERIEAFQAAYGPSGDWASLFRRASGYLRTELLRDVARPGRFLTIDYWESAAAWREFRARFAAEYEALDARCAELTISETEVGHWEPLK